MQNFNEAGLPQPLLHRLEQAGFTTPTPIQAKAIPHALQGRDILGSAQTGTGKTGAFGIPAITHIMNSGRGTVLVLLPTRELAIQVMKAMQVFIGKGKINTALLIGGESIPQQVRQIKAKPRLIIGTPGRVNDHLRNGQLMLHDTNFLVLDEVDRMLDLGFGIQLDEIAKYLTAKRQTLMFSATMPKNIDKLAAKYLTNPMRISVGSTHAPAANIKMEDVILGDGDKYERLIAELDKREGSVIVFVKTKRACDKISDRLSRLQFEVNALHGDLRQNKRNSVIAGFRNKRYRILIATDVAARGLDIPHIEHVINYDLPQNPEDFIHRIGRTARAGAEGAAVNFICPAERGKWRAIQQLLNPDKKFPKEEADHKEAKKSRNRTRYSGDRNAKPSNGNKSRRSAGAGKRTGGPSDGNNGGGKSFRKGGEGSGGNARSTTARSNGNGQSRSATTRSDGAKRGSWKGSTNKAA